MKRWFPALTMMLIGALLAGCGSSETPPSAVGKEKYLLTQEPAGARGVLDVKKGAQDGEEVVLVGRIGGSARPFSSGRAAFTIVDLSLQPCSEEGCDNPYCDYEPQEVTAATTLVKFVDGAGQAVPQDAQTFFGVKDQQTVVVRGRVRRTGDGGVSVLASGLYPRPATE